jgi:hypothetical protein
MEIILKVKNFTKKFNDYVALLLSMVILTTITAKLYPNVVR